VCACVCVCVCVCACDIPHEEGAFKSFLSLAIPSFTVNLVVYRYSNSIHNSNNNSKKQL